MLLMRGHNEGSLFRRSTGQWVALVTMRDGRRVSRWAKDRDAAKVELAELLRLRDAGAPMTGRVRLGDFLERWTQDDHGLAPATARKHESIVRTGLVPALGHIRLSELSVRDVRAYLESGRQGTGARSHLSARSLAHHRATLRRALADAQRDGLVGSNVAALARPLAIPHTERTILDATQARILIESTRDTRYGPLWTILVTTGLRISEALGLMWSSVDFGGNDGAIRSINHGEPGVLGRPARGGGSHIAGQDAGASGDGPVDRLHRPDRLREPDHVQSVELRPGRSPAITVTARLARQNGEWVRAQTKAARDLERIAIDRQTAALLETHRIRQATERRPDWPYWGLVFTTPNGYPLERHAVMVAFRDACDRAGIARRRVHDIRHSNNEIMRELGIDRETRKARHGHASDAADKRYGRASETQDRLAVERLAEAIG